MKSVWIWGSILKLGELAIFKSGQVALSQHMAIYTVFLKPSKPAYRSLTIARSPPRCAGPPLFILSPSIHFPMPIREAALNQPAPASSPFRTTNVFPALIHIPGRYNLFPLPFPGFLQQGNQLRLLFSENLSH